MVRSDLGFPGDDATGCDTLLSLGYVYNGTPRDANFANINLAPPSAGFDFFQGPKVLEQRPIRQFSTFTGLAALRIYR